MVTIAPAGPKGDVEPPRSRRPLLRRVLAGLLAGGITATSAWAWNWRIHPDVFPSHGNTMAMPLPSGEDTAMIGITDMDNDPEGGETVTIHAATPRVVKNTADATFEFYVCTLPDNGMAVLALHGRRFAKNCLEPVRLSDGTRLDTSRSARQQLVMMIDFHKPGVVTTRGVDLTYSHGYQRGTQAVGTHLRVVSSS